MTCNRGLWQDCELWTRQSHLLDTNTCINNHRFVFNITACLCWELLGLCLGQGIRQISFGHWHYIGRALERFLRETQQKLQICSWLPTFSKKFIFLYSIISKIPWLWFQIIKIKYFLPKTQLHAIDRIDSHSPEKTDVSNFMFVSSHNSFGFPITLFIMTMASSTWRHCDHWHDIYQHHPCPPYTHVISEVMNTPFLDDCLLDTLVKTVLSPQISMD